jgi:hypothetical protein
MPTFALALPRPPLASLAGFMSATFTCGFFAPLDFAELFFLCSHYLFSCLVVWLFNRHLGIGPQCRVMVFLD